MRIKSFKLGGHTIRVKYLKSVYDQSSGAEIYGKANFATNVIEVATTTGGQEIAADVIQHTINHELVHFMLYFLGEHELNGNEKFVDGMGLFIQQYNQTKK